jgi:hypothetical protein
MYQNKGNMFRNRKKQISELRMNFVTLINVWPLMMKKKKTMTTPTQITPNTSTITIKLFSV